MTITPRKLGAATLFLMAMAMIPFCSQSHVDQAVLDKADKDAADAKEAAESAGRSAAEAAGAAKKAQKAVGDLQAVTGPGS